MATFKDALLAAIKVQVKATVKACKDLEARMEKGFNVQAKLYARAAAKAAKAVNKHSDENARKIMDKIHDEVDDLRKEIRDLKSAIAGRCYTLFHWVIAILLGFLAGWGGHAFASTMAANFHEPFVKLANADAYMKGGVAPQYVPDQLAIWFCAIGLGIAGFVFVWVLVDLVLGTKKK